MIVSAIGCRHASLQQPRNDISDSAIEQEHDRLMAELRRLLPFSVGVMTSALPNETFEDSAHGLIMLVMTPIKVDEPNVRYFLLMGKFDGVLKVASEKGKVINAQFAWGTKETGLMSDFKKVF